MPELNKELDVISLRDGSHLRVKTERIISYNLFAGRVVDCGETIEFSEKYGVFVQTLQKFLTVTSEN